MAQKKGSSNTSNGRDSRSQRLGVKTFGGQYVIPGNIIIRQRGTKVRPGANVGLGKDHTIFAVEEGFVRFHEKFGKKMVSVDAVYYEDEIEGDEEETQVASVAQ